MDPQKVFEGYLKKGNKEGAFEWAMERLAWDPESLLIRGMAAFAFYLYDENCTARDMAVEVLQKDPDNEWALAALFAASWHFETVLSQYGFHTEDGFRLGHDWIERFTCLGQDDEARKVTYCLARYGSPLQKAILSEDWLVEEAKTSVSTAQLEFDLKEISGKKK